MNWDNELGFNDQKIVPQHLAWQVRDLYCVSDMAPQTPNSLSYICKPSITKGCPF
jgi:hypothetical protein